VLIGLALLIAPSIGRRSPFLIWNASLSVPIGIYWIEQTRPQVGDLALVRLTGPIAALVGRRANLQRSAYLLKPVSAVAGDRVCRFSTHVFVRRRLAALARFSDTAERPMPIWHGCRTLRDGEYFLLADHLASFDSRYFGPLRTQQLVGAPIDDNRLTKISIACEEKIVEGGIRQQGCIHRYALPRVSSC
jgi:type IV secretory pathway protease TraF